jgi:hypothetical protein
MYIVYNTLREALLMPLCSFFPMFLFPELGKETNNALN